MLSAHLVCTARAVGIRPRCYNGVRSQFTNTSLIAHNPAVIMTSSIPAQCNEPVRLFGSKKRRNKRNKRSKGASGVMDVRDKKAIVQEKIAMLKEELDDGYEYPVIEHCLEKGPESWATTRFRYKLRGRFFHHWVRWRIYIENNHSNPNMLLLDEYKKIQHNHSSVWKANYQHRKAWEGKTAVDNEGKKVEQMLDELWLQPYLKLLSEESQAKAVNTYLQFVSGRPGFITRAQNYRGDSNLPTVIPGKDNIFKIPLSRSGVDWVKRGQVSIICIGSALLYVSFVYT